MSIVYAFWQNFVTILAKFADSNFKFDENGRKFFNRVETLWKKEKLLVMSNFSFSNSVFKRHILQSCKHKGLFGKELNNI